MGCGFEGRILGTRGVVASVEDNKMMTFVPFLLLCIPLAMLQEHFNLTLFLLVSDG